MSILFRLLLTALIPVLLLAGVGFMQYHADRAAKQSRQMLVHGDALFKRLSVLSQLTQEHAVHFEQRGSEQWLSAWRQAGQQLKDSETVFRNGQERQLFEQLSKGHRNIGYLFEQYRRQPGNIRFAVRITSRIIQELQLIESDLGLLRERNLQFIAKSQRQESLLILTLISATALLVLLLCLLLHRSIKRQLRLLLDGFSRLSKGDLSHRLPVEARNELGQLSTAFNRMMETRQKTKIIEQDTKSRPDEPRKLTETKDQPVDSQDASNKELKRNCEELRLQNEALRKGLDDQQRINNELSLSCEVLKRSNSELNQSRQDIERRLTDQIQKLQELNQTLLDIDDDSPDKDYFADFAIKAEKAAENDTPATDQLDIPDSLPGIKLDALLEKLNGNRQLLARLIRLFAIEHQGLASEIGLLIREGDLNTAARLVHGLKGVAANLKALRLDQSAGLLEDALKMQDRPQAITLFNQFESALQEVCSAADLLITVKSNTDKTLPN